MTRVLPGIARDSALLIARIMLGVVLMAHGWQKLITNGLDATITGFGELGIPAPAMAAGVAVLVELAGGALLLLGSFAAVVGVLVVLNMTGAAFFVHIGNGVFVTDGGWELVAVIAAGALALAATGAGRFSVDHLLLTRSRDSATA